MPLLKPLLLALVLFLPAPIRAAAPPDAQIAPQFPSLAGQLLIASPRIGDPRFRRTVILMTQHEKSGALGIIINRPMGQQPLARVLEMFGEKDASAEGDVPVFLGGPVQLDVAFIVHTAEYRLPETRSVTDRMAFTPARKVLLDIAFKRGPEKFLLAFGYAGWAPGQLEAELAREDWFTAPANAKLVFDESRGRLWEEAMARRPRDL